MYEWMADSGYTPHLIVDARSENVKVPTAYIKDGRIVLNVSMSATQSLELGKDAVSFNARFGGVSQQVYVPVDAILGIYARETGQGLVFADDQGASISPSDLPPEPPSTPPDRPTSPPSGGADRKTGRARLKVVK